VLRTDRDACSELTLNRPEQANALSEAVIVALQEQLRALAGEDRVRVIVLRGRGRAFCAGHDLRQMRAHPDRSYQQELFESCAEMMCTLRSIPQPVIACVHGIATAAGCQLVASCDLAIASENARFATSGINLGLFCSTPAVAVSRNVPTKRAFEMLMTGDFVDAATAAEWGLINRVASEDELDGALDELVRSIVAKSPVAVATGKKMFYRQQEMDLEAAYRYAAAVMAENMLAEDAAEGIDAFLEKRDPVWRGR
jgi:enoyl-CoA hydratase/carnithine racemase